MALRDSKSLPRGEYTPLTMCQVAATRSAPAAIFPGVWAVSWRDTKVVNFLTNKPESSTPAVQPTVSRGKGVRQQDVFCPSVAVEYNTFMGGVDRADHLRGTYEFGRRRMKWWQPLFFWGIETCMTNAYIKYKFDCEAKQERPITRKAFRLAVIEDLVKAPDPANRNEYTDVENVRRVRTKYATNRDVCTGVGGLEKITALRGTRVAQVRCIQCPKMGSKVTLSLLRLDVLQARVANHHFFLQKANPRTSYRCRSCGFGFCPGKCFRYGHGLQ